MTNESYRSSVQKYFQLDYLIRAYYDVSRVKHDISRSNLESPEIDKMVETLSDSLEVLIEEKRKALNCFKPDPVYFPIHKTSIDYME